jgi:cytochrome c oxidase subunit 4
MTHPHGSAHGHSEEHISVKGYFAVFLALMALLVVTVVFGYIDLGRWTLAVAMLIASVKGALIVLYFMHVKYSVRWVALFFLGSLYVCGLGALLLFMDYGMRR